MALFRAFFPDLCLVVRRSLVREDFALVEGVEQLVRQRLEERIVYHELAFGNAKTRLAFHYWLIFHSSIMNHLAGQLLA